MNNEITPDDDGKPETECELSVLVFVGGCILCALLGAVIGWFLHELL
jgi:hypothetical protein